MIQDKEADVSEAMPSTPESTTDDPPPHVPPKSPRVRLMLESGGSEGACRSISPPLLPPRTRPSTPTSAKSLLCTSLLADKSSQKQVPVKVTTLKGLSERPEDLPAVIRFITGYYGKTSRFSVSAGDCFQVNLLKRTRVITFQDMVGREYTVPLSSSSKFGLLWEEACTESNPSKTISSIFAMNQLPHVICALTNGEDKKRKVMVSEGDLLVIKGSKKKSLQCYNISTGADILLHRHFEGTFTLDPEKTKMFPLEIANHLPDVFPCKAKLYASSRGRGSDAYKSPLEGKVVMLKGCNIDVSLVATEVQHHSNKMIHLPLDKNLSDLSIEVMLLENMQDLYDDTQKLMKDYDPSVGLTFTDKGSDAAFDIQSSLFRELRPDQKNVGIELVTNKSISKAKQYEIQDKPEPRDREAKYDVIRDENLTGDTHVRQQLSSATENLRPSSPSNAQDSSTVHDTQLPHNPKLVDSQLQQHSDHIYATIQELPVSIKPAARPPVKPRKRAGSKSPQPAHMTAECTLPHSSLVLHTQLHKSPALADPVHVSESDCEHIPIPANLCHIQQPIAKPRKQPSFIPSVPNPIHKRPLSVTTESVKTPLQSPSLQPKPQYVSLQRHPLPSHEFSTADIRPPVPSSRPPRRKPLVLSDKQNIAFLQKMDVSQVLQMLEALNLSQYQAKFDEEQVGGDILSHCDDATLENELGVNMKIHRLKLLQVISGERSARALLEDQ